jgi:hypothetical protein
MGGRLSPLSIPSPPLPNGKLKPLSHLLRRAESKRRKRALAAGGTSENLL